MKILKRKTIDALCEMEINNMLVLADTALFHEMPMSNYKYAEENSLTIIESIGGTTWKQKAIDIFNEKVKEAKESVEVKKEDK